MGAKCQGNAGERRAMIGECREMPGKYMEVCAMCQGNSEECLGILREWVQCARGMQGNAR